MTSKEGGRKGLSPRVAFFVMFFVSSVGTSLGQSAMLSRIGTLSEEHGASLFSYVVFATFFPNVFVAALQSQFTSMNINGDPHKGSVYEQARRINFVQCVAGFTVLFLISASSIFLYNVPRLLVLEAFVIGASSTVVFNAMQQTAASLQDDDDRERALVTFSLGYQLSGVVVLLCDETCDSRIRHDRQSCFFVLITLLTLCSLGGCIVNHQQLEKLESVNKRSFRDPYLAAAEWERDVDELLGSEYRLSLSDKTSFESAPVYVSPLILLSLYLTVTASAGLLPFYAHFQSRTPESNLPQSLFFVRMLSDSIARPSTLLLSRFASTPRVILLLSMVRLVLIAPLIALAASGATSAKLGWFQSSLVSALVCAFSFGSGFIVTRCYQLALYRVHSKSQTAVTGRLNTVFAAALTSSAIVGLLAVEQE